MSREEMEHAYQKGKLTRREFVRGLTAAGLSIAAANRMADKAVASSEQTGQVRSVATHVDDVYDAKTVSKLPSTGDGHGASAADQTKSGIFGLLGASAALAALGLKRIRKTEEEPQ